VDEPKRSSTIHLRSLSLDRSEELEERYPFGVPVIKELDTVSFTSPVTFFVGENGTGKSTLLEGIAAAAGSITVGAEEIKTDPTLQTARDLAGRLILRWQKRTHRGFFLRAEDFFNYAKRTAESVAELEELAADFDQKYEGYGRWLAKGAVQGQREALVERYGRDLNARSHGESFLQVFQARFVPGGLYLLDEPDTALSPQRQLSLLGMLKQMVEQDAQFIIATQSPMLMAFPEATIFTLDVAPMREIAYGDVDQVVLARSFLDHPEAFLRRL
jgi:predicted ATPase